MLGLTLGDVLVLLSIVLAAGGFVFQVRSMGIEIRELKASFASDLRELKSDLKEHFSADARIAERVAAVEAVVDRDVSDRIEVRRRGGPLRS